MDLLGKKNKHIGFERESRARRQREAEPERDKTPQRGCNTSHNQGVKLKRLTTYVCEQLAVSTALKQEPRHVVTRQVLTIAHSEVERRFTKLFITDSMFIHKDRQTRTT